VGAGIAPVEPIRFGLGTTALIKPCFWQVLFLRKARKTVTIS
jgi:hypothetical protein